MDSSNRRAPVRRSLGEGGFTLVEVVIAIGVFAVTIVAVLGLLSPVNRSVASVSDYDKAAALGDAIQTELVRLRDLTTSGDKLAVLATLVPASDSTQPLQLVASTDGSRVVRLADADNNATASPAGIAASERYFLVEIRQQPAPLAYTSGAGFVAVTATIKWPYAAATSADANTNTQVSSLLLNFAVPP